MGADPKYISAFTRLGEFLEEYLSGKGKTSLFSELDDLIRRAIHSNGWFTPGNVRSALHAIAVNLKEEHLLQWLGKSGGIEGTPKNIGVIMAGNIPLVGFHDFMAVILTGHRFVGKVSSQDPDLLPFLARVLTRWEPSLRERIVLSDRIKGVDAVIATGNNNTLRYFEYYFGNLPHIFRHHRTSAAVLSGKETDAELELLAQDIFLYFGLGCRNVSKIFVNGHFSADRFFQAMEKFREVASHPKYFNNYEYHKAVYLVNKASFLDNGFMLLKEEQGLASPVSVVFTERYESDTDLVHKLQLICSQLQCVVAGKEWAGKLKPDDFLVTAFGQAQQPSLWDYADGVDTLAFLRTA